MAQVEWDSFSYGFSWEVAPDGHMLCPGAGPCPWKVRRGRVGVALVKGSLRASCHLCMFFPLAAPLAGWQQSSGDIPNTIPNCRGTGVSGARAWPGHGMQQLGEGGLSDGQQNRAWLLVLREKGSSQKRPLVGQGFGSSLCFSLCWTVWGVFQFWLLRRQGGSTACFSLWQHLKFRCIFREYLGQILCLGRELVCTSQSVYRQCGIRCHWSEPGVWAPREGVRKSYLSFTVALTKAKRTTQAG